MGCVGGGVRVGVGSGGRGWVGWGGVGGLGCVVGGMQWGRGGVCVGSGVGVGGVW